MILSLIRYTFEDIDIAYLAAIVGIRTPMNPNLPARAPRYVFWRSGIRTWKDE